MVPTSHLPSIARRICGFILAVSIAAAAVYLLIGIGSVPAPDLKTAPLSVSRMEAGSEGVLQRGASMVPVVLDEELLTQLITASTSPDPNAISRLGGRIFLVDPLTSVRISETGANGLRVRILTGSQKGRLGWVPFDWVKPL